jgi:hypothetical protein
VRFRNGGNRYGNVVDGASMLLRVRRGIFREKGRKGMKGPCSEQVPK